MKLKHKALAAAFLFAVILIFQACKKFDFFSKETKTPEFTVAEAKEWYYGVFKKSDRFKQIDTSSPYVAKASVPLQKYPDWKLAQNFRKGMFNLVEMPYVATCKIFLPIEEINHYSFRDKIAVANATINKVIFIEAKGKVEVRLLTWIPTLEFAKKKGFDISNNTFNKFETDFSGYLVVRNWDESIINFLEIENGKYKKSIVTKRNAIKNNKVKINNKTQEEDCGYGIPIFQQVCVKWVNFSMDYPSGSGANGECAEWESTQIGEIWVSVPCPEDPEDFDGFDDPSGDLFYDCIQIGGDNCTCMFLGLGCDNGGLPEGWGVYPPNPPSGIPTSYNGYTFTAQDLYRINFIRNEIGAVDQAYTDAGNNYCYGTGKLGNMYFPGTVEHWIIQYDYISRYQGGIREYSIPNASLTIPSYRGYADLANLITKEIFEIKPNNLTGQTSGAFEASHYVSRANIECNNGIWILGANYSGKILPNPRDPLTNISTTLYSNGLILYNLVPRNTNPLAVGIPQNIFEKLKQLAQRLKNNLNNADYEIQIFLKDNPTLVTYIKNTAITAGVAIIVATIIEDILTLGAGIADDWACFLAGYKLIRFAMIMP